MHYWQECYFFVKQPIFDWDLDHGRLYSDHGFHPWHWVRKRGGGMRLFFSMMFLAWMCYYLTRPFLDWVYVGCSHKVWVELNHFVSSLPCRAIYFCIIILFLFSKGMDSTKARKLKWKAFAKPLDPLLGRQRIELTSRKGSAVGSTSRAKTMQVKGHILLIALLAPPRQLMSGFRWKPPCQSPSTLGLIFNNWATILGSFESIHFPTNIEKYNGRWPLTGLRMP